MNDPRGIREALVAQLAGELDDLLRRVDALTPAIATAGDRLHSGSDAINSAVERHQVAVATLSAQAMKSIGEFAVRRTNEAVVKNVEAQEALMQRVARRAFAGELVPHLRALQDVVARTAPASKASVWSAWAHHAATALLSSTFTALGVVYLMRI